MSKETGTPKSLKERYRSHYNCTWTEARLRAERGDPLPERGTKLKLKSISSDKMRLISNAFGIIGAIFGSVSLLIRLFEGGEEQ